MVKLKRKGVAAPPTWNARVEARLGGTASEFRRLAKRFERLRLNGARRRAGFVAYAPHVLPVGKTGKCEFPAVWRTVKAIKRMIAGMSNWHCAYCQSPVGADQAGQVEHFQPKNLFPTLAYDIGNYFLGCEACNTQKLDKWPSGGGYVRPDEGKPASRFVFHEDGTVTSAPGDGDADVTIRDFELDRKGLCDTRKLVIEVQLRLVWAVLGRAKLDADTKRGLVKELLVPRLFPYSAAINQSVRRAWRSAFPGTRL